MAKKYDLDADTIQDKYKDFLYVNEEKIEKEFYERNDFQTTVRGLKVRGVYDTHREAENRCKKLQNMDKNLVYILVKLDFGYRGTLIHIVLRIKNTRNLN